MPSGPRMVAAPTWTVRSVTVRTRDSAERLNQVYRRLINDSAGAQSPPTPQAQPVVAGAATPSKSRR
jgi:hypothetical protein